MRTLGYMDRSKLSIKNASFGLISQAVILIGQFILQTVFIRSLSVSYLGANGLFTNLISFLSFAELGIGSAITFSLYKPLSVKDVVQINAIMTLFKKVYQTIGTVILFFGLILTFFIDDLVKKGQSVPHLKMLFVLYLLGTVVSYFFTYTRSLLIANQDGYINSINQLIFKILQYVLQIPILIFTHQYALYLVVIIVMNIVSNIRITQQAYKKFSYLNLNVKTQIDPEVLQRMKHNVTGTISNKIGTIVVFGTDNILISKFIGLTTVGIYSNYTLIINGLTTVLGQGFNAVISSFGNLGVTKSEEYQKDIFFNYLYLVTLVTYTISSTLYVLVQPFISFWFGKNLLLSREIVFFIILNFALTEIRQATLGFISALGLFWPMRYKAIIEAVINLVLSLVLIVHFNLGVEAVLLGTLGSTILVNIWWEPLVLFRYGFHSNLKLYSVKYCIYILVLLLTQIAIFKYSYLIHISNFFTFAIAGIFLCIFFSSLYMAFFFKSKENKYIWKYIIKRLGSK